MTFDPTRAKQLFLDALERLPADRDDFLVAECGEDVALLDEVRSLLTYHVETDGVREYEQLRTGERYAERYRILRKIGRGGMGEVYHAHDEVLDESVALKRILAPAPDLQQALVNEVRLARRVTHTAVCRIHDLVEWQNELFLTMEFVDGEDLASLLRRVGRLPAERVAGLAQELCVGLAAAHAKGVLHCDLKPANILVDAEGRIRITDFGIAGLVGVDAMTGVRGTPSYMAPEQLVPGGGTSEQSDIYSLGLVLWEMLSGEPVFPAMGIAERLAVGGTKSLAPLPDVETDEAQILQRAITSALHNDPHKRPVSALELAAALPGGDPLLAALEAEVTPSPDLVANAPTRSGNDERFRRWWAPLLLITLLAATVLLADRLDTFSEGRDAVHPAVGQHRAVELVKELGYSPGAISQSFFGYIDDPTAPVNESRLLYWYAQDSEPYRTNYQRTVLDPAADLTLYVPTAARQPDRLAVVFDREGALVYFTGFAADSIVSDAPANWERFQNLVGLDPNELASAEPSRPPLFADDIRAWTYGSSPDSSSVERIDAAAANGRLVYYSRGADGAAAMAEARLRSARPVFFNQFLFLVFAITAIVFLIRNLRAHRVDMAGTLKTVGLVGGLAILQWILLLSRIHHPLAGHSRTVMEAMSVVPSISLIVGLFYAALEPVVRRRWPQSLMAWTRLMRRDFRSTLVGHSILIGAVAGALCGLIYLIDSVIPHAIESLDSMSIDHGPQLLAALGYREVLAVLVGNAFDAVARGIMILFLFVVLRTWLRRPPIATTAFVIIVGYLEMAVGIHHGFSILTLGIPVGIIAALVLVRGGLLAYVVTGFIYNSLRFAPITLDIEAWWFGPGFLIVLTVGLCGALGYWVQRRS